MFNTGPYIEDLQRQSGVFDPPEDHDEEEEDDDVPIVQFHNGGIGDRAHMRSGICPLCKKKHDRVKTNGIPFKYCSPECDKLAMSTRRSLSKKMKAYQDVRAQSRKTQEEIRECLRQARKQIREMRDVLRGKS